VPPRGRAALMMLGDFGLYVDLRFIVVLRARSSAPRSMCEERNTHPSPYMRFYFYG
jgi:hypothetical protein